MKIFLRVLRKLKILKRIKLYRRICVAGQSFEIPIINEVGLSNYLNLSERWMTQLLEHLIQSNTTILDVGVNLGQTLLKVKALDSSVNYIGFEPNPVCIAYLEDLIEKNGFINTSIYPVAISDKTGISTLNLYNENQADSSASIVEAFRNSESIKRKVHIPVYRFSDLDLELADNIALVKIDVEGAELEVLTGISDLLNEQRPVVLLEILPAYQLENTFRVKRQEEIGAIFKGLSYGIFRIQKKGELLSGLEELDSIPIHSNLDQCDYIGIPKEKEEVIVPKITERSK